MQAELQRQAEAYDKSKSTMNATKQAETEKNLQDMYNKIQQTAQDNQKAFNESSRSSSALSLRRFVMLSLLLLRQVTMFYIMEKAAGQPLYINEALSKDITAEVKAQLAKMK